METIANLLHWIIGLTNGNQPEVDLLLKNVLWNLLAIVKLDQWYASVWLHRYSFAQMYFGLAVVPNQPAMADLISAAILELEFWRY